MKEKIKTQKSPIDGLMKKKAEEYEEIIKLIDELTDYLKPIVGEDNEEVNKRLSEIRFKVLMMPMTDMISHTLHASFNMFAAGKKLKEWQEDFDKDYLKNNPDFEKFIRGQK